MIASEVFLDFLGYYYIQPWNSILYIPVHYTAGKNSIINIYFLDNGKAFPNLRGQKFPCQKQTLYIPVLYLPTLFGR
jgi:hypothetical protein